MALSDEFQQKLDYMEKTYFAFDEPVPFKGGLLIYPVLVKDYFNFHSYVPCLNINKNVKKEWVEDKRTGDKVLKNVANKEGLKLSYLAYLITLMKSNTEEGAAITQQLISLLKLVFRKEDCFFCPNCFYEGEEVRSVIIQSKKFEKEMQPLLDKKQKMLEQLGECLMKLQEEKQMDEEAEVEACEKEEAEAKMEEILSMFTKEDEKLLKEKQDQMESFLKEKTVCPKCGKPMREYYTIKNGEKAAFDKLCVGNIEINSQDFEELKSIIMHYNVVGYDGDKYIDPTLKADLELKAKLQSKGQAMPSLEKQMACICISSPYTIKQIKEEITLRKLSILLRLIDSKPSYYAQIQGAYSGMVKFKEDPKHWIYGDESEGDSKQVMSMDALKEKFKHVT